MLPLHLSPRRTPLHINWFCTVQALLRNRRVAHTVRNEIAAQEAPHPDAIRLDGDAPPAPPRAPRRRAHGRLPQRVRPPVVAGRRRLPRRRQRRGAPRRRTGGPGLPAAHGRADPAEPVRAATPAPHGVRAPAAEPDGARRRPLLLLPDRVGGAAPAGGAGGDAVRRRGGAGLPGEHGQRQDALLLLQRPGALRRRGLRLRDEGRRRHLLPAAAAGGVAGPRAEGGPLLRLHGAVRLRARVERVHVRHGVRHLVGPRGVDRGGGGPDQEPHRRAGGQDALLLVQRRREGQEPGGREAGHVRLPAARRPVRARARAGHHRRAPAQEQLQVVHHAQVLQLHRRARALQVLSRRLMERSRGDLVYVAF
ncbi:hypothetical protein ACQJBY_049726 [Aegilops geniculata]